MGKSQIITFTETSNFLKCLIYRI